MTKRELTTIKKENDTLKVQIETMKEMLRALQEETIHCFVVGCGTPAKYEGWHIPGGGMMRRQCVCERHKHILGPKGDKK